MIDASRSLELAGKINSQRLLDYLLHLGWTIEHSAVEGWAILSTSIPGTGDQVELLFPVRPGFPDERRRVADALRVAAALESTTEDDIASRLQSTRTRWVDL
jgi:hypothetical protein